MTSHVPEQPGSSAVLLSPWCTRQCVSLVLGFALCHVEVASRGLSSANARPPRYLGQVLREQVLETAEQPFLSYFYSRGVHTSFLPMRIIRVLSKC